MGNEPELNQLSPLEVKLREIFPEYWCTLDLEEDIGTLEFGFDDAKPIYDRLVEAGFVDDERQNVDRDMRDGYQSVEHRLKHPGLGEVVFSHSMAWEPSLFELPGTVSSADQLTWDREAPRQEFYIGHPV